jgi:hypothetical protein
MKLLLSLLVLAAVPLSAIASLTDGQALCAAALIKAGSGPTDAVNGPCKKLQAEGQGLCAAALIENGFMTENAVDDCLAIESKAHGICAAAMINTGYSTDLAIDGECK